MTADEARVIGLIVGTADGGCSSCARALRDKLQAVFPEHDWVELVDWDRDYEDVMTQLGFEPNLVDGLDCGWKHPGGIEL